MATSLQAARANFHVDLPDGVRISHPSEQIWGRVAGAAGPASLMARVEGTEMACGRIDRGGFGADRFILDAVAGLGKPAHPNVIHLEILDEGVSGFDAKRLADIDTATGVRGSDKRSPSGGTPDPIAGRRKAASKGGVALPLVLNRGAPVWLARLSRLPGQAGAARFDAGQIEQTPTSNQANTHGRRDSREGRGTNAFAPVRPSNRSTGPI